MNEIKTGACINYISIIVRLATQFFLTPFTLSSLGDNEYGIFMLDVYKRQVLAGGALVLLAGIYFTSSNGNNRIRLTWEDSPFDLLLSLIHI